MDLEAGVFRMYAHEISGGMKQRVCIAIGILLQPQVIIADEPTSALDVVTQRQVMETIDKVQDEINAAVILIGHDMGQMAQFVDRVAVMYAGRLVELASVQEMFTDPKHPYSQALISFACPRLDNKGRVPGYSGSRAVAAATALGLVPSPALPAWQNELQRSVRPEPVILPGGRMVTCHPLQRRGAPVMANLLELNNVSKVYTRGLINRRRRWRCRTSRSSSRKTSPPS